MKITDKIKEIHEMFEVKDGDILEIRALDIKSYQVNDLMLESIITGEQISIANLEELEHNKLYTRISHADALERLDSINNREVSVLFECELCQAALSDSGKLLEISRLGNIIKTDLVVGLYKYECFMPVISD